MPLYHAPCVHNAYESRTFENCIINKQYSQCHAVSKRLINLHLPCCAIATMYVGLLLSNKLQINNVCVLYLADLAYPPPLIHLPRHFCARGDEIAVLQVMCM